MIYDLPKTAAPLLFFPAKVFNLMDSERSELVTMGNNMGHATEENAKLTGTAQITLQVCLQRAIFSARFRGMQLESEDMAYSTDQQLTPQSIAAAPRRDLVLRAAILRNVVSILKNRLALLDADILQAGRNDLQRVATAKDKIRFKVFYTHPTFLEVQEVRVWAYSKGEAIQEAENLFIACGIDQTRIQIIAVESEGA